MLEKRLDKMEKMLYPGAPGSSSNAEPPKATTPITNDDVVMRRGETEASLAELSTISHNGPHIVSPTSFSSHSFPSPTVNVSPRSATNSHMNGDLLPPMDVIEHLVQLYFDYLYTCNPIFDRTTLMRDIREKRCSDFLILCILSVSARMALELGLNKEIDMEDDLGETQSADRWMEQELRRRLFWNIFTVDKLTSASTGRPSFLQEEDCDVFLPSDEDGWTRGQFYTETLDRSRIVHFNVRSLRDSNLLGVSTSVSSVSTGGRRAQLSCSAHQMRLIALLGKVTTFINRGSKKKDILAPFDPTSEFSRLDRQIEDWYEQLPLHMKNTPANFERYRTNMTMDTSRYALAHMLHNALIVLLHRPSLVLAESLTSDLVQPNLKEFVNHSVEKCLTAVENVTVMLKAINGSGDIMPPFMSYISYTVATIVVNNTFSSNQEEAMHAKAALSEHFRLLESMRSTWAMADKLYFMIRDLYAMHSNVQRKYPTPQSEQGDTDQGISTSDRSSLSDWPLTYTQENQVSPPVSGPSVNGRLANIPVDQRTSNQFRQSSFDQQSMQPMMPMTNIATMRKMSLADLALSTCDGASTTNWILGDNSQNVAAAIQSVNRAAGTSQHLDFQGTGCMIPNSNSTNLPGGGLPWNDRFSSIFFKPGQTFPTNNGDNNNDNDTRFA
ncbi:hypothetical protein DFQ28_008905 [Apophysomyces sp. BC1034]|nr:hypothetical protein DFQ28_008905 [Apophysomyces sp. BC1034]